MGMKINAGVSIRTDYACKASYCLLHIYSNSSNNKDVTCQAICAILNNADLLHDVLYNGLGIYVEGVYDRITTVIPSKYECMTLSISTLYLIR